jgi:hypothetical protein
MKEIIEQIQVDKLYFYCETFYKIDNFMKNHPNYLDKIKDGNNGYIYCNNPTWGKNNFCFYILNDNNEKIPISYTFSKRNVASNKKDDVTRAFRSTVDNEILNFKKSFIKGITKCAITGEVLNSLSNANVDHHNHDFAIIVKLFLEKYNKTYDYLYQYVYQVNTKRLFNNEKLISYFIDFHNENTTLRFTTKKANLSKEREKL